MFRKWILSAVAGLTLLTSAGVASASHDRRHDNDRCYPPSDHCYPPSCPPCHCYQVMYRQCCHDSWCCYGSYDCYDDACSAEHGLRSQGYEVRLK